MKKITEIAGAVATKLRDRSRSVKLRLFEIARIAREGPAQSGAAAAALSAAARYDEPGGGPSEAVLEGDIARREAVGRRFAANRPGGPAHRTRPDGAADAAGGEPNPRPPPPPPHPPFTQKIHPPP